jgi:hypothetical protein
MNRKKRNWTFWALVFSLNLVPLVASGGDNTCPDNMECADGSVGKSTWKAEAEAAAPAPAEAPKPPVAKAERKATQATQKKVAAAPAPVPAPAPAPAAAAPGISEARVSEIVDSRLKPVRDEILSAIKAGQPAPRAAADSQEARVPRGELGSVSHPVEMSLADFSGQIIDFDRKLTRPSPNHKAVLMGLIYNECKDSFQITNDERKHDLCGGAPTFRVFDKGLKACMDQQKALHPVCNDDFCSDISELPGASINLAGFEDSGVAFNYHLAGKNKDNSNQCESLGLNHETAATIEKRERDRQIHDQLAVLAECHTSDEITAARQANEMLVTLGYYGKSTMARNEKLLDQKELKLLQFRASHASQDDLDQLATDMTAYAGAHSDKCNALVDSYQLVAKKYVGNPMANRQRRPSRNSDDDSVQTDPLAGYVSAINMMDDALNINCFKDNAKMADMRENLDLNRVEQEFEMTGGNSMEAQADYRSLTENLYYNASDACSGWMIDQAAVSQCQDSMQSLQKAQQIPGVAGSVLQARAASNAAIMNSIRASMPQQQQGAMNGMANPYMQGANGSYGMQQQSQGGMFGRF